MNLKPLTSGEARELARKVGDLHAFKSRTQKTSYEIAKFDIYKDIDSPNKDIYVALKADPYSNYEDTGETLY